MSKVDWAQEIECGPIELFFRRKFTALFYTNLYRRLHPSEPWLTPGSIRMLKKRMPGSIVFEYGSGMSTIWYAERAMRVIAVEHDITWFKIVETEINQRKLSASIHFQPVEVEDYSAYESQILAFEDNFFDIVVVDGRSRVNCIRNSISKVKNGGLILLDDSQRPRYRAVYDLLEGHKLFESSFGFKRTSIWEICR